MTRSTQCVLLLMVVLAGCPAKPTGPASSPPVVIVSQPVKRTVQNFDEFTGRTDAVETVDVKARVSGYLTYIGFQAGSVVRGTEKPAARAATVVAMLANPLSGAAPILTAATLFPGRDTEGDLLFIIDPKPYQAEVDKARAQVNLTDARLILAKADLARAREVAKTPGAISQQELDKYIAAQAEADASVKAAKANLEVAQVNLDFTRISAPTTGRISRNYLTLGNLVTKDETLLTTIVSEDPIFAYVDIDDNTRLRVKRLLNEGRLGDQGRFPILLARGDEEGFPHRGTVDFVNNKVDQSTGTISIRGVFDNPRQPVGPRPLTPGEFVRVRLPLGEPYQALLVAEKALTTDQGQKILFVVDGKNVVQYRRVKVGPLQPDGLRVILDGIGADDRVIVSGLQDVRPRMEVTPQVIAMPTATNTPSAP